MLNGTDRADCAVHPQRSYGDHCEGECWQEHLRMHHPWALGHDRRLPATASRPVDERRAYTHQASAAVRSARCSVFCFLFLCFLKTSS